MTIYDGIMLALGELIVSGYFFIFILIGFGLTWVGVLLYEHYTEWRDTRNFRKKYMKKEEVRK